MWDRIFKIPELLRIRKFKLRQGLESLEYLRSILLVRWKVSVFSLSITGMLYVLDFVVIRKYFGRPLLLDSELAGILLTVLVGVSATILGLLVALSLFVHQSATQFYSLRRNEYFASDEINSLILDLLSLTFLISLLVIIISSLHRAVALVQFLFCGLLGFVSIVGTIVYFLRALHLVNPKFTPKMLDRL